MKNDITANSLISENDVFADIANVNLFDGDPIIAPEDLTDISPFGFYPGMDEKQHRLIRDTIKQVDKLHGTIAFIGFENQNGISNIMPVRDMGYSYTSYMKQIQDYMAENRKNGNPAYAKGIHDDQKLKPCVTYILYFGRERWQKPLSLMDMLDINAEDKIYWERLIEDHKIKVIHMADQPEEIRRKYKSDYKVIADFLACGNDKEKINQFLAENDQNLIHVEQVLDFFEALTTDSRYQKIKEQYLSYDEKARKENSKMCVMLDMLEERGKVVLKVQLIRKKYEKNITAEDIAALFEFDLDEVQEIITLLELYPQEDDTSIAQKMCRDTV